VPVNKLFEITGKRILITGSSGGLGGIVAAGLASCGAELILNGRNEDKLKQAVQLLREQGHLAHYSVFDVTDLEQTRQAIKNIEQEIGPIDVLVNNAGIQRRAPLIDFTLDDWDDVLDTNLKGAFITSQAVARNMIARKRGKIINICSLQSEMARPTIAPYAASKGGLQMLTRSMATEWAGFNIQVNGIGPGYFKTELTKALYTNEAFDAWLCKRTPANRWGNPEELVGAAVFLASEASSFVNGQIIFVDGGILACI
jgi:gluconate 5-dehydrogenase